MITQTAIEEFISEVVYDTLFPQLEKNTAILK